MKILEILEILEPPVSQEPVRGNEKHNLQQTSQQTEPRNSHQTSYGMDDDNKHTIETDNGTLKAVTVGNHMRIEGIMVTPEAQGQGQGLSLLKRANAEANSQGLKLASDEKVSAQAIKVWQQLSQSGVKVIKSKIAKPSKNGGLYTEDGSSVFVVA